MKTKKILKALSHNNVEVHTDKYLKDYTTFKIGGRAKIFVCPKTIAELKRTIEICKSFEQRYFILGAGSNLLVSDKTLNIVFIKLAGSFNRVSITHPAPAGHPFNLEGNLKEVRKRAGGEADGVFEEHLKAAGEVLITAGGAVNIYKLNNYCISKGLSGLEFSFGIPGSVGGAVYMNAGAYGGEFSDVIEKVWVLTDSGEVKCFKKEELKFGYRTSCIMEHRFVILKAAFKLQQGSSETIKSTCKNNLIKKIAAQPYNKPSAGSVFKRQEGVVPPVLIEQCGLKGLRAGGAGVSTKHCGFIVNNGGATYKNVSQLIAEIKKTVYKKHGIMLKTEVVIVS